MIRIIFMLVIFIHGAIHSMGFVKEFGLGLQNQLNGNKLFPINGRLAGSLWLLTTLLFITSGMGMLAKKDWYWIPAAISLLISQALIVIYWRDARWGTVANVVVLIVVIIAVASYRFNEMAMRESAAIINRTQNKYVLITEEKVRQMPSVIQTWLRNSSMVGKEFGTIATIRQRGTMRSTKTSEWIPFEANHSVTIDPPGFVWNARMHYGIDIAGRDKYENGRGNMLIKAAALFPVANQSGKEIDQGTMIRYMAEMVWYPQAVFSDYLKWEQISENQARVTMTYADVTATGVFTFNEAGFPVGFEAKRYGDFNGKYSLETWSIKCSTYRYFNGVPISSESEVTWKLKDGDFTWLKLTISDIEYKED